MRIRVFSPIRLSAIFAYEYKVAINAENENGTSISVGNYLANGYLINSTPYLQNGTYRITGALYKGVWLNASKQFVVRGPASISIRLPVYSVQISTYDLFGLPVNASLYVSFANGTEERLNTGPYGRLVLYDVPYGIVNGTASFLFAQHIYSAYGRPVALVFLSPGNLLVILVLSFAFILFGFWLIRERRMNIASNNKYK